MIIQPGRFTTFPVALGTSIDPNQNDSLVTLSNGNLTATKSATNSVAHSIAKHGKIAGKWRFQVSVDTLPMSGGELSVGCSGPFFNRNNFLGSDVHGGSFVSDGRQGVNGSFGLNGLGTWSTSDVIDVYVDADARQMWFGKNGSISGNPTTGASGISLPSFTRAFFPTLYMHGGNGQLTANFSGPFTHSLHPDYIPWDTDQTCDRDTFRAAMIYIRSPGYFAHCIGELSISTTTFGTNLLTGTASSAGISSGNGPSNAFDGNTSTWWEHTVNSGVSDQGPSWIANDLGTHGIQNARFLALRARSGTGGEQWQAPTLFDLYFSSDGISWEKGQANNVLAAFDGSIPGINQEISIAPL
jgi:hypothetical protein